jgi:hypothetical protein
LTTSDATDPNLGDDTLVVSARYQLPTHVWVASDVLGTVTETRVGRLAARIHTPGPNQSGRIEPPPLPHVNREVLEDTDVPWTHRYAGFTHDPAATALRIVGLELFEEADRPLGPVPYTDGTDEHRIITAAGTHIARWFDVVRTWIELLTTQDLDPRHPVYDANTIGPGFEAWRNDKFAEVGFTMTTPRINEVTLDDWRFVLRHAADDRYPPAQHVLARDARAAFIRDNFRKAVLDAATSAEITLAYVYDQEWPKYGSEPPMKRPMLHNYIEWLTSKAVPLAAGNNRLEEQRDARNRAIHTGADAAQTAAYDAVDAAYRLVVGHTPL